ncbi:phosphatidylinositol 4-kinase [Enterococcus faecalis]|uniref:HipA family kinase n=1 Tax=Enterococcus faecalis TaxID=1351 RepID=UPI002905C547|nr:HipA family kinase [Enterococcus faecalis]MCU2257734.1 phosphatidylinositol 4-kinase [Enterococcus faecalis]
MRDIIEVVNHLNRIPNGITKPSKIQANDGNVYVMKCIHENCSGKILFNELIAYRLGILLEIPMPRCEIGLLTSEVIEKTDLLIELNAKNGSCFLSSYRAGSAKISPIIANNIVNCSDIAKILVFDQIILNNDRARNDGNLYYDKKEKKLLAIDHSHIFINGEIWSVNELQKLKNASPVLVTNLLGRNYKVFSAHLTGHSCFHDIRQKVQDIRPQEIRDLFINIPEEWGINEDEKKSCLELINEQMAQIDGIIRELQNIYSIRKGG